MAACDAPPPERPYAGIKDTALYYPYAPVYTTAFDAGKPVYGKTVLNIWKQYETGDISHAASFFADSVTLIFPDTILSGGRDTVLIAFQKRRTAYANMQCYIDAWMPVRAHDANEELVLVWGRQDGTTGGGRRDYRIVYETWRFNGNGKIKGVDQYLTHPH